MHRASECKGFLRQIFQWPFTKPSYPDCSAMRIPERVRLRNLHDIATLSSLRYRTPHRPGTTPHPKRSPTMDIIRSGSQAPVKGLAEYFTGEVTIEWQFSRDDPARL